MFHPRRRREVDEGWVMMSYRHFFSRLASDCGEIVYAGESSVCGNCVVLARSNCELRLCLCERKGEKNTSKDPQAAAAQLVHYSACGGYYWRSLFELLLGTTGPETKAIKHLVLCLFLCIFIVLLDAIDYYFSFISRPNSNSKCFWCSCNIFILRFCTILLASWCLKWNKLAATCECPTVQITMYRLKIIQTNC